MNKIILFFSILFSLFLTNSITAQTHTTQAVKEITNKGPIYEGLAVKGYFIFYQPNRKKSKSIRILEVLDENLNLVFKKEIKDAKYHQLEEIHELDGNYYVKLEDRSKRDTKLWVLDQSGKILYEETFDIFIYYTNSDHASNLSHGTDNLGIIKNRLSTLHSIPGIGIFSYNVRNTKGIRTFIIHFFGEDDHGQLSWKYIYENERPKICAEFLGVKNNTLYSLVFREIYLDVKHGSRAYIEGIDLNTGELVFSNELSSTENKLSIRPTWFKIEPDNDKIMMHGWFYNVRSVGFMKFKKPSEEDIAKVKSPGYIIAEIDQDGKIQKENKIPSLQLRSFFPKRKNGNIYYCTFHNIIHSGEQSFLLLESYRHTRKLIKDLVLIELDEDYQMVETHVFKKPERKARLNEILPKVSRYGNWGYDEQLEKANYDYVSTTYNPENDNFIISYQGEKYKQKDGRITWLIGTITFKDGEWIHDFYFQESKADDLDLLPAPYGSILLVEQDFKTKEVHWYYNDVEME